MTAQVCPNGAKRTNSIQLLDTINATAFSTMLQPQIKPFSVRFSTASRPQITAKPRIDTFKYLNKLAVVNNARCLHQLFG